MHDIKSSEGYDLVYEVGQEWRLTGIFPALGNTTVLLRVGFRSADLHVKSKKVSVRITLSVHFTSF